MEHKKPHLLENLTHDGMVAIQERLRGEIADTPLSHPPKLISGVDAAYSRDGRTGHTVIVTFDYESRELLDVTHAAAPVTMPYRPGLLAFRELPLFLKAWEKLAIETDLVVFDGQGRIHPRRMGIATHAGFFIDKPTMGIAKSRLVGTFDEPAEEQGSYSYITDGDERIGAVYRSKRGTKPVFVSAGNRMTLEDALAVAAHFSPGDYRIPAVTRMADHYSKVFKSPATASPFLGAGGSF